MTVQPTIDQRVFPFFSLFFFLFVVVVVSPPRVTGIGYTRGLCARKSKVNTGDFSFFFFSWKLWDSQLIGEIFDEIFDVLRVIRFFLIVYRRSEE